jgi:hypothetical protein
MPLMHVILCKIKICSVPILLSELDEKMSFFGKAYTFSHCKKPVPENRCHYGLLLLFGKT